jgi:hypothetical protein
MANENDDAWFDEDDSPYNAFLARHQPMSIADHDAFFDFLIAEGLDPTDMSVSELEVAWGVFPWRREA